VQPIDWIIAAIAIALVGGAYAWDKRTARRAIIARRLSGVRGFRP
jgi:hypothetical protein